MTIRLPALAVALILAGCSAFMHGYTIQDVVRTTLPAREGDGLYRLQLEQAIDPTLRAYVEANGPPDYIHVHSRFSVSLLYVAADFAVRFSRTGWDSRSGAPATTPITLEYIIHFSETDRVHLTALRADDDPDPLQVQGNIQSGTCFVVSPDGLVATSRHVVETARIMAVALESGGLFQGIIEASSAANDLALVRIQAETPNYLDLAGARSARTGDPVFTLGYPTPQLLGVEPRYTEGVISALSGLGGDASFLQVSVPIQPGNSGGPLVNERGEVVGIITSQAAAERFFAESGSLPQSINFAIKAEVLRAMFDAPARGPARGQDRRETVEHVRRALCMLVAE